MKTEPLRQEQRQNPASLVWLQSLRSQTPIDMKERRHRRCRCCTRRRRFFPLRTVTRRMRKLQRRKKGIRLPLPSCRTKRRNVIRPQDPGQTSALRCQIACPAATSVSPISILILSIVATCALCHYATNASKSAVSADSEFAANIDKSALFASCLVA